MPEDVARAVDRAAHGNTGVTIEKKSSFLSTDEDEDDGDEDDDDSTGSEIDLSQPVRTIDVAKLQSGLIIHGDNNDLLASDDEEAALWELKRSVADLSEDDDNANHFHSNDSNDLDSGSTAPAPTAQPPLPQRSVRAWWDANGFPSQLYAAFATVRGRFTSYY